MADSPPLTPDGPTARRWLSDELAKPAYEDQTSLIDRLWRWVSDHLGGSSVGGMPVPGWVLALVLIVALALVFAVSWRRHRPTASVRQATPNRSATVFDSVRLDAAQYLRQAHELRGRDDVRALLAAYRALVVRAEDVGMLRVENSTTVGDVTLHLGEQTARRGIVEPAFGFADAGRAFETVRYGHHSPATTQVDEVLALEALLVPEQAAGRSAP